MKTVLGCLLFLFLLNEQGTAQVDLGDSTALVALYNGTNGPGWLNKLNWLIVNKPVSEWEGIVVAGNRVVSVSLTGNNLNGILPTELGNLTELTILDLSFNALLNGAIPGSLSNLNKIEILNLSGNGLSGTIPNLSSFTNLSFCELFGNQLTGTVPSFSSNSFLFYLDLSDNILTGPTPGLTFANTPELFYLDFSDNQLSGSVPTSLGTLINLETVILSSNTINGNIPAELSNNVNLTLLDLSNNQLAGAIPASFTDLTNLATLSLHHNLLTGEVPAGFGNIPGLSDLSLNNNQLSGSIPLSFCSHNFESLLINNNQFTFDGMECLESNIDIIALNYANQKTLTITNNNSTLSVTAGGTLANNTYTWFKDDVLFAEKTGDPSLVASGSGSYKVEVTNNIATQLTLLSDPIILSPLPLTWLSFTATNCSNNVCLKWQTDNEVNTAHFEIEKSIDGRIFERLTTLASHHAPGKQVYQGTDYSPVNGTNYYRIKQVDLDGKYSYSDIISVKISRKAGLAILPNPASNFIVLTGIVKAERVSLFSMSGQILRQWQHVNGNQQLNVSGLQKGVYIIKVLYDNGEAVQKLIKQ